MTQYVDKTNSVNPIEKGTVIDHLKDGIGDEALHHLKIPERKKEGHFKTYVQAGGLDSTKMGSKDIIKIYDFQLPEEEAQDFLKHYPMATVNIIEKRILPDTRYKNEQRERKMVIVIHKYRMRDERFVDLKAEEDIGRPIA
jgi:aspartate carbamoyltransferase regulatory subunit